MKAYLIAASHELARRSNIDWLKKECPFPVEEVCAIYPSRDRVPFISSLLSLSKDRIGRRLLIGELGCLLSHRSVWHKVIGELENEVDHALILESDSQLMDPEALDRLKVHAEKEYDLFFWGAWEGHMQFFRSSKKKILDNYTIGEPFIKTVYCTYGYSLNKKAARLLLNRTARIGHPVDQFKYFFGQKELRLGGVLPEIISGNAIGSTIRKKENAWLKWSFLKFLDFKNALVCACR